MTAGQGESFEIPAGRTLADLGYRMPAEWEPHEATWVSWPHNAESWPGDGCLERAEAVFAEAFAKLSRSETLHVNVNGAAMESRARRLFDAHRPLGDVRFHRFPTNDAWCRDHGAIVVARDEPTDDLPPRLALDWQYNAWGGKYPPWDLDDEVARRMAGHLGVPILSDAMVLEGGSIDVNGSGLLLTTESCLLNPNRNPELDRNEIERRLRDQLGVTNILWLGDGIAGDDTDGHIDDLARFVGERTIVTTIETDPSDANHNVLATNLERLRNFRTPDGEPFEIVTLPMPRAVHREGRRLPATYANFYVANEIVLVPFYDPERDEIARETLAGLFPTREIVGLDCTDVVWGLGAFHCLTQQIPAVR